jgi:hypothetical protein
MKEKAMDEFDLENAREQQIAIEMMGAFRDTSPC